MDSFTLIKIVTALALPPVSMFLGLAVGTSLILLRRRRIGWLIMGLAVAELGVLCLPPVSDRLVMALETEARASADHARPCCYAAIVVLGGGVEAPTSSKGLPFHLAGSADRVVEGAYLFHKGVAPRLIVSGNGGEAEAMRRFLMALDVPSRAIVVDDRARNTLETIQNVRDLVEGKRVAFVTSAYHMPRVLKLARRANIASAAFPTDVLGVDAGDLACVSCWVPSLGSLNAATLALHEILALAFDYRRPQAPSLPPSDAVSAVARPEQPS